MSEDEKPIEAAAGPAEELPGSPTLEGNHLESPEKTLVEDDEAQAPEIAASEDEQPASDEEHLVSAEEEPASEEEPPAKAKPDVSVYFTSKGVLTYDGETYLLDSKNGVIVLSPHEADLLKQGIDYAKEGGPAAEKALPRKCVACGLVNSGGEAYCKRCGALLAGQKVAIASAAKPGTKSTTARKAVDISTAAALDLGSRGGFTLKPILIALVVDLFGMGISLYVIAGRIVDAVLGPNPTSEMLREVNHTTFFLGILLGGSLISAVVTGIVTAFATRGDELKNALAVAAISEVALILMVVLSNPRAGWFNAALLVLNIPAVLLGAFGQRQLS
jgi:hypothetical protein